jgi:glycosyltransferase involved in cell wall biosynthesis
VIRAAYFGNTTGGRGIEVAARRMISSTSDRIRWTTSRSSEEKLSELDAAVCVSGFDVERIKKRSPGMPVLWIMCVQPRFSGVPPEAIRSATRIMSVSRSVKSAFPEDCQDKVFVLENAVTDEFRPGPKDPALRKPFPVLLYVGRADTIKGADILVKAAEDLPCQTWIVGSVGLPKRPENSEKITFWGHRHDVLRFYRSADAFVLPSRTEGMSLSLLEAMAVGLPCMASDIPPNRETLAGSGVLFDLTAKSLSEAAVKVFGSDELRKRMSEDAVKAAAPRAIGPWADRFVEELERTISC